MRYIPFIVCATVLLIMFIDGWVIQKYREKKKLAFAKLAAQRDKEKTDLALAIMPFQKEIQLERQAKAPNLKLMLLDHQQRLIDLDYDPVYEKVSLADSDFLKELPVRIANNAPKAPEFIDSLVIDLGHCKQRLCYYV